MRLEVHDHDRDRAGLTYVYPVVSRRAGGVSIGVNLNPNNACNWRCVYCQVPNLVFGNGPPIDLAQLERELEGLLREVLAPGWMERNVPDGARRLNDVAISGNGEPTSSPHFVDAVRAIGRVLERVELAGRIRVVLITNGSLAHKPEVQRGLSELAELGGEVWFKLDSATEEGQRRINSVALGVERTRTNLELAARAAPTWIQTCVFARNGLEPSRAERDAYLGFVGDFARRGIPLRGVLLYGIARESHQPEAPELAPLPAPWLEAFAGEIRARGLEVRVTP